MSKELHPRAVLEQQRATAEREAVQKREKLERVRDEGRGAAVVEQAAYEAERTAATLRELAAQVDKVKEGEKSE